MIGVLADHYMRCAIDSYSIDTSTFYWLSCTTLARTSVKPWTEIIVRSLGNDQDLFGHGIEHPRPFDVTPTWARLLY